MEDGFNAVPYTNALGQVFEPGDEVIYLATSWKSTKWCKGIYFGVQYGETYFSEYEKDENGQNRWKSGWRPGIKSLKILTRREKFFYDHEARKGEYREVDAFSFLQLKRIYKPYTPVALMEGVRV